jgi:methylmalonyl-CoA/ethylmalonyl-CoA epimerase
MSDTAERGLSRIGQVAMPVQDVERASAFYQHKLGIRHLFTVTNLAFFDCDGVRLMLTIPEGTGEHTHGSVLYFSVPDLQQMYATLQERGVQFEDAPHIIAQMDSYDLWMVFFRDSEQNLLGLMSEVPRG